MNAGWLARVRERYEALSERERVLVFVMVLALLWAVLEVGLLGDLRQRHRVEAQSVDALQQQVEEIRSRQSELDAMMASGPLATARAQASALQEQIAATDAQLRGEGVRYLDPEHARQVLRELVQGSGVELVAVRSLAPEVAFSTNPASATVSPEAQPASTEASADASSAPAPVAAPGLVLYRHPIEVEVDGGYLDLLAYVRRLEESGWRLRWHSLTISSQGWPRARLHFVVHSFSLEEDWIGV